MKTHDKKYRFATYTLIFILTFALILSLIFLGYQYEITGFSEFESPTGEYSRGKTLWDWLELIIIPIFLSVVLIGLNMVARNAERNSRLDKIREDALQSYFDRIAEFIKEYDWDTLENKDEIRSILRARTLTVLRILDGERKGLLLRFLYQTKLIETGRLVIDLSGADLSYANLSGSDEGDNRDRTFLSYLSLSKAHLFGVNLSNANLKEAKLSEAILINADLTNVDFTDAHLMYANLTLATMKGAILKNANLLGANLTLAKGLTKKQLSEAKSLLNTLGLEEEKN